MSHLHEHSEHSHSNSHSHNHSCKDGCTSVHNHSNESNASGEKACSHGHCEGCSTLHTDEESDDGDHSDSCHSSDECGCGHEHSHSKKVSKNGIILLAVATMFFVGASLVSLIIPNNIIRLVLFGISVLLAGYDLFISGVKQLVKFQLEENVLLLIAVVACFVLGEYPEACLVTILFKLGGFIESYAINRSQKSMEALTKIRPDFAVIKDETGNFVQIDAKKVAVGDVVYLRAGDRVAVDCEVISGQSSVDTSALTGEAIPEQVSVGSMLLSGSINLSGIVQCRVVKTFENSTASQIIDLVYSSSKAKGKTESFISRVARVYTPIVILLAIIIAVVPPLLSFGTFHEFIMRSLIFLVASCPCALVISIPLTFFSGIGAVSKQGVLVKGSMYIEKLAKISAVAFDKTGTLTSGKLQVDSVQIYQDRIERSKLLSILASAEAGSTHPIATAVIDFCNGIIPSDLIDIEEQAGLGVKASLDGDIILCGGANMLIQNGIISETSFDIPPANIYVCINGEMVGYVTIKEQISNHSLAISKELGDVGVKRVVMLTGDNKKNADIVASQCDISEVYSGLLPIGKVECVERIKADGDTVLFVGDGINDAPVLTVADLGMSMGLGSEIANASSDVILSSNTLGSIPKAISIAKRSMSVVYFNIIFALAIKVSVLILGAFGVATMWFAVFADIGVTILTVLNAVRLLRSKYK